MTDLIGVQTSKIERDNSRAVVRVAEEAGFKSLKHAAFSIRKSAVASMVRAKGPSAPGQPPHRHRGRLAGSIRVGEEGGEYVVGSSYATMQGRQYPPWMAKMHEHGGTFGVDARTGLTSLTKTGIPAFYKDVAGKWHRAHGGYASRAEAEAWIRAGSPETKVTATRRKAAVYPARPFMLPALQRAVARFNQSFGGGIGG